MRDIKTSNCNTLGGGAALGMIKNPNPTSSLGIRDFGFNIPWASVLLVIKTKKNFNSSNIQDIRSTKLLLQMKHKKGFCFISTNLEAQGFKC